MSQKIEKLLDQFVKLHPKLIDLSLNRLLLLLNKIGNPYSNIAVDSNGKIAIDWGVYGVPETFLVDSNNKIILRLAGPITNEVLNYKINPELRKLGL